MDTAIDVVSGLCAVGVLVFLSAVVRPWGPFQQRWHALLGAFGLALVIGGLSQITPERPTGISQSEWDRRTTLCRAHAADTYRDCVRDPDELKKAEAAARAATPAAKAGAGLAGNALPHDPNDRRIADNSKIAASALIPYTRKDDADIFQLWGAKGVRKIEALRKAAAYAVAKKDGCDVVDQTEIADQLSKPPSRITIYVMCRNESQYFLTQDDINNGTILSEADWEVAVKTVPFRNACSEGAQSLLRYPSSYDQSWFGGGTFKDDAGNHGLQISFEALNGFGNKIPQVALCTLMPNGKIKIQLRAR